MVYIPEIEKKYNADFTELEEKYSVDLSAFKERTPWSFTKLFVEKQYQVLKNLLFFYRSQNLKTNVIIIPEEIAKNSELDLTLEQFCMVLEEGKEDTNPLYLSEEPMSIDYLLDSACAILYKNLVENPLEYLKQVISDLTGCDKNEIIENLYLSGWTILRKREFDEVKKEFSETIFEKLGIKLNVEHKLFKESQISNILSKFKKKLTDKRSKLNKVKKYLIKQGFKNYIEDV